MINNHKSFMDCYKTSLTVYFYGIGSPVLGISMMLREEIMKKFFLDTKGKFIT